MISRETENVQSSKEVESAFQALSNEGKPYVTKEELYQVCRRLQIAFPSLTFYFDLFSFFLLILFVRFRCQHSNLLQNLSREQADYCIANMPPYYDSHGISVLGAYDYVAFTRQLFNN